MDYRDLLLSPQGRIGQREFWIGVAILIGGNLVAGLIPFIGQLIGIFLIYVGVCVYVKRLHDSGRSGWWHAVPWAITLVLVIRGLSAAFNAVVAVGAAGAAVAMDEDAGLFELLQRADFETILSMALSAVTWLIIGWLVWLVYTLWVGLAQSEAGENKFGPVASATLSDQNDS
jgi:uncharacterized membrane protein YhaH (DUF805 family)